MKDSHTFRVKVEHVRNHLGVNADGSVIDGTGRGMIIIDLQNENGEMMSIGTSVYEQDSRESRRAVLAQAMSALSAILIRECFPEDTPRYKITIDPNGGFKHVFEGMPEDLLCQK
jgi:hypothetical protein